VIPIDPNLPVIEQLASKLLSLERRREFLNTQIARGDGSDHALSFARSESNALGAAIDALKYHRTIVNRMDSPLSMLRELTETEPSDGDYRQVLERARIVLDEFGA